MRNENTGNWFEYNLALNWNKNCNIIFNKSRPKSSNNQRHLQHCNIGCNASVHSVSQSLMLWWCIRWSPFRDCYTIIIHRLSILHWGDMFCAFKLLCNSKCYMTVDADANADADADGVAHDCNLNGINCNIRRWLFFSFSISILNSIQFKSIQCFG